MSLTNPNLSIGTLWNLPSTSERHRASHSWKNIGTSKELKILEQGQTNLRQRVKALE